VDEVFGRDRRAPFLAAALYCGTAAIVLLVFYRPPAAAATAIRPSMRLTRREWILTLIASLVWAAFNAAYIVYLSFAPRLLMAGSVGPLEAASIISLASWVMIFSGAACGQLADRLGRSDLILSICLCTAMASILLLSHGGWGVPLSLAFGLIGMAPAGIIMALTGSSMAPEKRAFGMGVFLSAYFVLTAPAPGIAGWLYDWSHDAYLPIVFAVSLFALTLGANFAFRLAQRALATGPAISLQSSNTSPS
jgi:MFS family permease